MKPKVHLLLCFSAALLVLGTAYILNGWVLVGAERSNLSGDGSFTSAKAVARLIVILLMAALSWLMLHRPPSVLLSGMFLVVGGFFSLLPVLVFSGASLVFALPLPFLLGSNSEIVSLVWGSLSVLGLAGFIRLYAFPRSNVA